MYVCVCMYVCMYACIYLGVYVSKDGCMPCMDAYILVGMVAGMNVCTYECRWVGRAGGRQGGEREARAYLCMCLST